MSYRRVAPRDLFNESKLLKCLGKISVYILDYGSNHGVTQDLTNEDQGFIIEQTGDGDIYCSNYFVHKSNGEMVELYSRLNSRDAWPLVYLDTEEYEMLEALNDDGSLTIEFKKYLTK